MVAMSCAMLGCLSFSCWKGGDEVIVGCSAMKEKEGEAVGW